ncbi:MAG: hypothetical protein R3B93_27280 [Bacteroidia bacterium]
MKKLTTTTIFLLLTCLWMRGLAQSQNAVPLFQSDEILKMTIKTEMRNLLRDRGDERDYHEGVLIYEQEGVETSLPVELRIRGNFRRKKSTCQFPPIRLKFDSAKVSNSLFADQDKVKLVTHCQSRKAEYQQYLLKEYLVYKMYNQLTDTSFRVRMMEITYIDTGKKPDTLHRYGFVIEDEDHLAARLGGKGLEVPNIHPDRTDYKLINTLSVFEFMIGNTDFSVPGLHNIKLIMTEPGKPPLAVPYDFDWSGLVRAPYAQPNESLGIRNVRVRLFRGFCRTEEEFEETFQIFRDNKNAILGLFRNLEMLDPDVRDDCIQYLEEFYETINDPQKVKRNFLDMCRTDK